MNLNIIFLLLFLLFAKSFCRDEEYCKLTPSHVLCINPEKGPKCIEPYKELPFTDDDIDDIVDWHNRMRQKVANGLEVRGLGGSQPPAANMMKMEWDPELAKIAQSTANQCVFKHDCNMNVECRGVIGDKYKVGQNLAKDTQPCEWETEMIKLISGWYEVEVVKMDPQYINKFDPYKSHDSGHYTQVIYWNSRSIGCGSTFYGQGSPDTCEYLIFCNYGSAGNWPGKSVYINGTACSQCPTDTKCDVDYPGLCAITKDGFNVEDKFNTDY